MFLYYKGDFDPRYLDRLTDNVVAFERLWSLHEKKILQLIPEYTGFQWLYKEIHVYCFQNAPYYDVPSIADPVSINMSGENLELHLLYLIHELVHVITQDTRVHQVSLDTQEAIAFFVGNKVLEDILNSDYSAYLPGVKAIQEAMFDERNKRMTDKISQYLQEDSSYFVVVGAGHLIGENGIVDLLSKRGYTAKRM